MLYDMLRLHMRAFWEVEAAGPCSWEQAKIEEMGGTEDSAHIPDLSN